MKKLLYLFLFIPFISFSQETKNVLNIDTIKEEYIKITNGITYYDGKPYNGVFISNWGNGLLRTKTNYKDGKKNGLSEDYYENGQLCFKENYKDGIKNGLDESYYESGQLRAKRSNKDGWHYGLSEMYYENGQLQWRANYRVVGGTLSNDNDLYEEYYENGQLKKIENKAVDLYEEYYENGQLYSKKTYKYGKVDGLLKYYENGQLKSKENLRDGEKNRINQYYKNGQLASKRNYKDGKSNGLSEWYYENGQLASKGNYKDGKPYNGVFINNYENGQLKYKVNYKDGELNGLFKKYDLNGKLVENLIYRDGKIVTNLRLIIGGTNIEDVNVYDLEAMVKLFLKDCELNNIKLSSDYKITSTFETLDKGVLALAYGIFNDEEIIIKVNPQDWSNASNPKRWYILYHELGHDVLNLQHGQGGKMMFNYSEKDYNWEDFIKDKDYMFSSMKKE